MSIDNCLSLVLPPSPSSWPCPVFSGAWTCSCYSPCLCPCSTQGHHWPMTLPSPWSQWRSPPTSSSYARTPPLHAHTHTHSHSHKRGPLEGGWSCSGASTPTQAYPSAGFSSPPEPLQTQPSRPPGLEQPEQHLTQRRDQDYGLVLGVF